MIITIDATPHVLDVLTREGIRFQLHDATAAIQAELERGARYKPHSPKMKLHLERLAKLRSEQCESLGSTSISSPTASQDGQMNGPSKSDINSQANGGIQSTDGTLLKSPSSPMESESAIALLMDLDGATRSTAEKAVKRAGTGLDASALYLAARTYLE